MSKPGEIPVENQPDYVCEMLEHMADNGYPLLGEPLISAHAPAWVAQTAESAERPALAIRFERTDDPQGLYRSTFRKNRLLQELGSHGAQVMHCIGEPWVYRPPSLPRGQAFVASASEFLPGSTPSHYAGGQAVGSLQNASRRIALHSTPELAPLAEHRIAADYLREQTQVRPIQTGEVILRASDVKLFAAYLDEGEGIIEKMDDMALAKNRMPVVLLWDVHAGNFLSDHKGEARLIDLDGEKGCAELDIARPLDQWRPRFGDPQEHVDDFMKGYTDTVEVQPDPELTHLAKRLANISFATVMLRIAAQREQAGSPSEWHLKAGLHRMNSIDDPSVLWPPLNDSQKVALAQNSSTT